MTKAMPSDAIARIRELYFKASPATIDRDFARAIELLKSMPEDQRARATVFMEGLNDMRKEFKRRGRPR